MRFFILGVILLLGVIGWNALNAYVSKMDRQDTVNCKHWRKTYYTNWMSQGNYDINQCNKTLHIRMP